MLVEAACGEGDVRPVGRPRRPRHRGVDVPRHVVHEHHRGPSGARGPEHEVVVLLVVDREPRAVRREREGAQAAAGRDASQPCAVGMDAEDVTDAVPHEVDPPVRRIRGERVARRGARRLSLPSPPVIVEPDDDQAVPALGLPGKHGLRARGVVEGELRARGRPRGQLAGDRRSRHSYGQGLLAGAVRVHDAHDVTARAGRGPPRGIGDPPAVRRPGRLALVGSAGGEPCEARAVGADDADVARGETAPGRCDPGERDGPGDGRRWEGRPAWGGRI